MAKGDNRYFTDDKTIMFFVAGEPVQQPKNVRRAGGYGVTLRDPKKRFAAFRTKVMLAAREVMLDREMIPAHVAVRLGVAVWVTKARSNRLKHPAQRPDWSNYRYGIENIIQGIVYHEDSNVIGPLPGDKNWADHMHEVGVLITVKLVEDS